MRVEVCFLSNLSNFTRILSHFFFFYGVIEESNRSQARICIAEIPFTDYKRSLRNDFMPIEYVVCVTVNIETLGDTFPSLRNPMQLWLLGREEFSMPFHS